ncbi:MAG: hypothetical protein V7L00_15540 [Nostoc sp.]
MKTRQRTVSLPKALISLQMEYHSGDAEREQRLQELAGKAIAKQLKR